MVIVLIDSCYSNKIPQTGWFINTSIAPMVLEAESSRYWTVYSILQREKKYSRNTVALCFLFYYPLEEEWLISLENKRRNWLPVAHSIPTNPALENPGGLPGGGDGKVPKDEKKRWIRGNGFGGDTRMWKFLEAKENMVVWGKGKKFCTVGV